MTELGGASGVVTLMDSTILTEQERRERERRFPNWCEFGNSYLPVFVFDALINQRQRNANNLSYGRRLTQLRLTDHASSFGSARQPPDASVARAISETLRQRLNALTRESLTDALDGLISPREIRALLKRRDQIVLWPGLTGQ